jgi:prepilin-type N-terminal cleavage/methylation domain-containing protein
MDFRANMTGERTGRLRSSAGYSVIELLTAVAIFAVMAAAGLPHINRNRQDINNATSQLVADYRWTRARSITGGVHFALKWTSSSAYQVQRLKLVGTNWTLDQVIKDVSLPANVTRSGTPAMLEFNTRGMMISTTTANVQDITDSKFNAIRHISVWPSGQIHIDG